MAEPARATTAPRAGRRPRTSAEAIVNAAIALVDEGGATALSIRRLAERLAVDPMTIYGYVPGKAALIDRILLTILAETEADLSDPDWLAQTRAVLHAHRGAFVAHPRAFPLLFGQVTSPEVWERVAVLQGLLQRHLGADGASRWMRILVGYVNGFLASELDLAEADPAAVAELTRHHPVLARLADRSRAQLDADFDEGLTALLDRMSASAAGR